jgi:hypothetical protein
LDASLRWRIYQTNIARLRELAIELGRRAGVRKADPRLTRRAVIM